MQNNETGIAGAVASGRNEVCKSAYKISLTIAELMAYLHCVQTII